MFLTPVRIGPLSGTVGNEPSPRRMYLDTESDSSTRATILRVVLFLNIERTHNHFDESVRYGYTTEQFSFLLYALYALLIVLNELSVGLELLTNTC